MPERDKRMDGRTKLLHKYHVPYIASLYGRATIKRQRINARPKVDQFRGGGRLGLQNCGSVIGMWIIKRWPAVGTSHYPVTAILGYRPICMCLPPASEDIR